MLSRRPFDGRTKTKRVTSKKSPSLIDWFAENRQTFGLYRTTIVDALLRRPLIVSVRSTAPAPCSAATAASGVVEPPIPKAWETLDITTQVPQNAKQLTITVFDPRQTLVKVLTDEKSPRPGDRAFSWNFKTDDGVDTGPILVSEEYIIPRHVQTPAEHIEYYFQKLSIFVCEFIKKVISSRCDFESALQLNFSSTYYPRIHTPTHGWIDWSWPATDIEKFVLALDDPYPGARSNSGRRRSRR
jgi:hypothetical protein